MRVCECTMHVWCVSMAVKFPEIPKRGMEISGNESRTVEGKILHHHPGSSESLAASDWLVVGSWHLKLGSWQLAVGSWKLAVGSWQLEVDSWQLAVGVTVGEVPPSLPNPNCQLPTVNCKLPTANCHQLPTAINCQLQLQMPKCQTPNYAKFQRAEW